MDDEQVSRETIAEISHSSLVARQEITRKSDTKCFSFKFKFTLQGSSSDRIRSVKNAKTETSGHFVDENVRG